MLCNKCQEREATIHITSIVDNVSESHNMCEECYQAVSPGAEGLVVEARLAPCHYCGGPPFMGGPDILAISTGMGAQQTKFMCRPCHQEFHRYIRHEFEHRFGPLLERLAGEFERFPDGLPPSHQEQLAALGELREAVARHMKQWVSQRGSQ